MYLVVGGTGAAGSRIVAELVSRGMQVRVLTRGNRRAKDDGVSFVRGDLLTGAGLAEATANVHTVIDASDGKTPRSQRVLTDGAENLMQACWASGVERAVLLSIVNVDQCALGYYRAKAEQERLFSTANRNNVVVRSTQFHEFLGMMWSTPSRARVLPVFTHTSFQPIDLRDVAAAVVDAARSESLGAGSGRQQITIGGPEILSMRELARQWTFARQAQGKTRHRALTVPVHVPGKFGAFLRAGRNLVPDDAVTNGVTFGQWLSEK
ncbi:NAD(P)H-binding protein [Saxibacter everestensis]|uniref:NAD(P)H-binding protein n=1 Tax=Saxibacter everestensis TaxID=2909229 RepID=A0ABY8QWX1_9MICO|nr:NAD(P)H-binding protein [Brevibacteriaceae bacterium ZFBP1038]